MGGGGVTFCRNLGSCGVDRAWITKMEVNNFLLHFYRFGPVVFAAFFNLAVKKCFW